MYPGCEGKHEALGYCEMHYARVRRTGSPEPRVALRLVTTRHESRDDCDGTPMRSGNCRCESRAQKREQYRQNPEAFRDRNLRRYGISTAEYDAMFTAQECRCAICRRTPDEVGHTRRFHVDHDHETKRVRGILCGPCNHLLGAARDDVGVLEAAIAYLSPVVVGAAVA